MDVLTLLTLFKNMRDLTFDLLTILGDPAVPAELREKAGDRAATALQKMEMYLGDCDD